MVYWLDQRRSRKRMQLAIQGRIIADPSHEAMSCIVTDLSDTGARLTLPTAAELPPEFDFVIPDRLTVRAQVAWSQGQDYGIMFLAARSREHGSGSTAASSPMDGLPELEDPSFITQFAVQEALDEARFKIAATMGVPADSIRLTIEIVS